MMIGIDMTPADLFCSLVFRAPRYGFPSEIRVLF